MRGCSATFLVSFILFVAGSALGQDTSEPVPYHFRSDTVWSNLKVDISAYPNKFETEIKSTSPLSGWVLRDEKNGKTASRGTSRSGSSARFEVAKPFQDGYALTVFVNVDGEDKPVAVKLSSTANPSNDPSSAFQEFAENPDRPFNKTVKNIYEKALYCYSQGDAEQALSLLKQARELDPSQQQVLSMLEKIGSQKKAQTPSAVQKAEMDLKKGKKEQALAELEDYLNENPDDQEALDLKTRTEDSLSIKRHPRSKPATPVKPTARPSQPTEDQASQADEAYNLGLSSYAKNDYTAAKKFWEETLKLQPTHIQARRNLDRLKTEHPELK